MNTLYRVGLTVEVEGGQKRTYVHVVAPNGDVAVSEARLYLNLPGTASAWIYSVEPMTEVDVISWQSRQGNDRA